MERCVHHFQKLYFKNPIFLKHIFNQNNDYNNEWDDLQSQF
jgi:hypothetical protein